MLDKIIIGLFSILGPIGLKGDAAALEINVNPERLVKVIGQVDGQIIAQAELMHKLTQASNEPIWVLVNSPGGYVTPGLIFLDSLRAAQADGITIKCVTGVMAASMAFITLSMCDEVYSMPSTMLLFHPMRIGGEFTTADMEYQLPRMKELEAPLYDIQRDAFGFEQGFFQEHYERETMWKASVLAEYTKSITIVDKVNGVDKDLYKFRRPTFFGIGKMRKDLIHIAPGFEWMLKGR